MIFRQRLGEAAQRRDDGSVGIGHHGSNLSAGVVLGSQALDLVGGINQIIAMQSISRRRFTSNHLRAIPIGTPVAQPLNDIGHGSPVCGYAGGSGSWRQYPAEKHSLSCGHRIIS